MRKIRILGKEVSVLVVAFVIVAVSASAALVAYLSNSLTATVSVSSPMKMWFDSDEGKTTMTFGGMFGGDTVSYVTHAKNLGANSVEVYKVIHVINSDYDWTGAEFDSVKLCDLRFMTPCPDAGVDIKSDLCHIKPDGTLVPLANVGPLHVKTLKLIYADSVVGDVCTVNRYTHDDALDIENYIDIKLADNIQPGNFNFKLCHLYDLTGDCP